MKIAICISGHLRKFEETYPSLNENLLNHYDCDVFLHTWDRLGYICKYKKDAVTNLTHNKMPQMESLFKPKKTIVESSIFIEELKREADLYAPHLKNCPKHVSNMSSMFYKIYACNELRKRYELESGVHYDLIIRSRPDLMFHKKIPIPNDIKPNTVFLPAAISGEGWYSDQFAIADPNSMDLYSSAYFDIPEYFQSGGEYYPEKFLKWSFDKKKLEKEFVNTSFTILR